MKALSWMFVAAGFFVGVVSLADWYLGLPVMQLNHQGKCIRVIMIENDQVTKKPCAYALGKRYTTEYVGR